MQANPVLIEQTRGAFTENRYRGAFVVCDAAGAVIAAAGEVERPVFPRSAIKAIQALAIFTTYADQQFDLTDEELALACASHHGEDVHVAGVRSFLGRIGVSEGDLECGAHQPVNAAAREALRTAGRSPSPVHNNCSGKHAGMLAAARALGAQTKGYVEREHPVQAEVRRVIETVIGERLAVERCGTDGCSIPTWAAPLSAFARGFARMATGKLPGELGPAAMRVLDAAASNPLLVAGTGHFDTLVMEVFGGRLVQKGGAEGVQCGAIRGRGWGYALKIDDGNMAASVTLAAEVLLAFADADDRERGVLSRFASQTVRNVRGLAVGDIRGTAELRAMLATR
jgi:L-asparaginase II